MKIIDLSKTIYELCTEDKEVISIMKELGFEKITNPVMLKTVGKVMTIPNGAKMQKIDLEIIKAEFKKRDYKIIE